MYDMFSFINDISESVFVTGTSTGVGKTFVSKLLCKNSMRAYWKPIETGVGVDGCSDFRTLSSVTKCYDSLYTFKEPMSPHLAARMENRHISIEAILERRNKIQDQKLLIEGAGGILVPINNNEYMIDLIKALNIPAIIVTKDELGTINHTLMTARILRQYGIRVLGFVMNFGKDGSLNSAEIEKYGQIKLLQQVGYVN